MQCVLFQWNNNRKMFKFSCFFKILLLHFLANTLSLTTSKIIMLHMFVWKSTPLLNRTEGLKNLAEKAKNTKIYSYSIQKNNNL